ITPCITTVRPFVAAEAVVAPALPWEGSFRADGFGGPQAVPGLPRIDANVLSLQLRPEAAHALERHRPDRPARHALELHDAETLVDDDIVLDGDAVVHDLRLVDDDVRPRRGNHHRS